LAYGFWGLRLIDLSGPAAYDDEYRSSNGKIHFL